MMNSRAQLVFPFRVKSAFGAEDFIAAPCNERALRFVQRWPDWPARAAVLWGPTGCGKSHLAAIWRKAAGAHVVDARGLAADALDPWPLDCSYVIEDFDSIAASGTRDRALLALFERPSAWLLLTARTPPAEWESAVGDLTSRFSSLIGFAMWAPDDSLLTGLVAKHFADRQIAAPDAVVRRIVTQLERTPEAIGAFVARADEKALAEKRAVTERLVLELLEAEAPRENLA